MKHLNEKQRLYLWLTLLLAITFSFALYAYVLYSDKLLAAHILSFQQEIKMQGDTRQFHSSFLRYQSGIPTLVLRGSPHEMGLAYGALLKDQLHIIGNKLQPLKQSIATAFPWYLRLISPIYMKWEVAQMEKRLPNAYQEELKGISESSAMSYDDLVFAAFGGGLFRERCTSILVKTPTQIIHGRNFDFAPYFLGQYPVIVHYFPSNGIPYWNFGVIGYLPSFNGINEAGISISQNYGANAVDLERKGIPTGFKIREILAHAHTLREAEKIIQETENDEWGWILTIASADEKNGVVYDLFSTMKARSPFTEKDYKLILNRLFSPDRYTDTAQFDGVSVNDLRKKALYLSDALGEYNIARFTQGHAYLKAHPIHTIEDMLAFLKDTNFYGYEIPINEGATIANNQTMFTLVFDWAHRKTYCAFGMTYSPLKTIYAFDLTNDSLRKFQNEDPKWHTPLYQNLPRKIELLAQLNAGEQVSDLSKIIEKIPNLDPYLLERIIARWEKDPSIVPASILLKYADQFIQQYPRYHLVYDLKARLLEKRAPIEAIHYYQKGLQAPINFVPAKVIELSRLAFLHKEMHQSKESVTYTKKCLNIIDEMRPKYHLNRWIEEINTALMHLFKEGR